MARKINTKTAAIEPDPDLIAPTEEEEAAIAEYRHALSTDSSIFCIFCILSACADKHNHNSTLGN